MNSPSVDIKPTKKMLYITSIETPLGKMQAAAVREGICLLEFNDEPLHINEYSKILKFLNLEISESKNKFFDILKLELSEYFEGKRKEFSVPLILVGSDFQVDVWNLLRTIPYGTTQSYKQQALSLNHPGAIRAMAQANGQNPLAIIIPCHRVIGATGKLVGYSGGLWRKKWLLEHERNNSPLIGKLF